MTTNVFESYVALAEQDAPIGPAATLEERASALEDRIAAHTPRFIGRWCGSLARTGLSKYIVR